MKKCEQSRELEMKSLIGVGFKKFCSHFSFFRSPLAGFRVLCRGCAMTAKK